MDKTSYNLDWNNFPSLKHLFSNSQYNKEQYTKLWKENHKDKIKEYVKEYYKNHPNITHGYCDVCNKEYTNKSQHNSTKKHQKNVLSN